MTLLIVMASMCDTNISATPTHYPANTCAWIVFLLTNPLSLRANSHCFEARSEVNKISYSQNSHQQIRLVYGHSERLTKHETCISIQASGVVCPPRKAVTKGK